MASASELVAGAARSRSAATPQRRLGDASGGVIAGLHPLLFAAYPVLFLWSQNLGEAPPGEVLHPLLVILGAVGVATLGLGVVARDRRRAALVVTPLVLGVLSEGRLAGLLPAPDARHAALAVVTALGVLGALRLGRGRLAALDTALLVLGAVLVAFPLASIVPSVVERALAAPPPVLAGGRVLPSHTDAPRRDVYWLVFDRYGSDRALELRYGVANPLTPWLRDRGFRVLDDSHANYVSTALSLATTLNMAHLEELTGLAGSTSSSYEPLYARLQSSLVVRQFQALGYRYLHLGSWFNATRTDEAADANYDADGVGDFTSVLFEQTVGPELVHALGLESQPPSESTKHYTHNRYALDVLDSLPAEPGPKFVWAHVLLPHPPYVFDRDGRYMPPEEAAALGEREAWERQLDYTNARLEAFLGRLLALPADRQPIIILQGDEGPWTAAYAADKAGYDWTHATPDDLEVKFGILNAWYVPGGADLGLSSTTSAINTFPTLFGRYFGLDERALPDRVTASRDWNHPYLQADVTRRLPSLRGSGPQARQASDAYSDTLSATCQATGTSSERVRTAITPPMRAAAPAIVAPRTPDPPAAPCATP